MDVGRLNGFPEAKEESLLLESRNPAMVALLETIERAYITWVLQSEGGNKSRAAQILGIERKTLYRKLERMK